MLRLGTIFSGIGAPEQACKRLFNKVENVFACEIDKFARKSYELNYDIKKEHFYIDITETDFTPYKGKVDLVVGGSPCFVAGTKVLTDKEYKNIEDIKVGDYVLTHAGKYQKVLKTGGKIAEVVKLYHQNIDEDNYITTNITYVTLNHPYYVKRKKKRKWIEVKDLIKGDLFYDVKYKKWIEYQGKSDVIKTTQVYNLEVENDNSYTANNLIVHNCQSFSLAGKRGGFEDTRGTLFFEYARCIKECEPDYFVYENVKGLVSHDKGNTIDVVLRTFGELGYKIDAKILNTKDYNVPQNRERIYIVGKKIKADENYIRKPLEKVKGKKLVDRLYNNIVELHNQGLLNYWYEYEYEKPYKATIRLKDILEDEVNDKFYLSQKFIEGRIKQTKKNLEKGNGFKWQPYKDDEVENVGCITCKYGQRATDFYLKEPIICAMRGRNPDNPSSGVSGLPTEQRIEFNQKDTSNYLTNVSKDNLVIEPQLNQIGKIDIKGNDSVKRVYSPDGICPTLTTMGGGNREPKIAENIKQSVRNNFIRDYHKIVQEFNKQEKKVFYCECKSGFQDNKVCLTESASLRAGNSDLFAMNTQYKIRKLTPLECFRLQDFPDDFLKKIRYNTKEQLVSNSQLYKQAGNSMTVKVVEVVIKNLFK